MYPRHFIPLGYPTCAARMLCTTALTLSLIATGPRAVLAQDLVYRENSGLGGNDWNIGGSTNWQIDGIGPAVPYSDGAAVVFEDDTAPYTVDITEDVAPGAILFADDPDDLRTLNGAGGSLSTNDGLALQFDVTGGFVDLDVDVVGNNRIIFNDNGAAGSANLLTGRQITSDIDLRGGVLNNFGTITVPLALDVAGGVLSNQITGTEVGGITYTGNGTINGPVNVTGGTLNNAGNTTDEASITGAVVVSGTGQVNANGGRFASIDVQTGGTLNVAAATDADVTVSGGQGNIDGDLTGTLDVTDGIANVSAGVSGATTITGGQLNNETGGSLQGVTLSNDGTLNLNGGTFTNLGLNGGTLNINADTTGNIVNNGTDIQINPLGGTVSVTGTIDNALGALTTFDGATVTGLVTNRADGVLVSEGGTYQSGIRVEGGNATINGATTLGTPGTPGTLTNEAGTVTLNADVSGNLANTGAGVTTNIATLNGDLSVSDGRFVQNGPVSSAGVTGTVTITNGTLEVAGGTFDQTIENAFDGTIVVTGTSVLDITNSGRGAVTVTTTGDMTGTLRHDTADSRFDINGRLNGDLRVTDGVGAIRGIVEDTVTLDGGVTTLDGAAQINGTTTVNTAILNAQAGTFAGDVQLNAGADMNVGGAVSGNITNTAGDLHVTNAGNLTGSVDQNGGMTRINGTLSGNATVAGGTFTSQADSTVTQDITVNGGAFTGNGGTIAGGLDVAGGTADIAGTLTTDVTTTGGITTNAGTLRGGADVAGGTFITETGSSVLQDVTVDGGTFLGTGGTIAGGLNVLDGTADITGMLNADVTTAGGTTTNAGTLVGDVTSTGGVLANESFITGTLDVNGGAVTQTTGAVSGQTTVSDGQLSALGGGFDAGITNTGGQVDIRGPVSANVMNTAGQLSIGANAALSGNISNADSLRLFGELSGDLTNAGAVEASGTITGAVTNSAGTFMLNGATLTGDIANFANIQTTETVSVSGTIQNADRLDVQTGRLMVDDGLTNTNGATVNIASGARLDAQNAVNQSAGLIVNNGTLTAALENAGVIQTTNGTFNGGLVTNTGEITGDAVGALRFEDGLNNDGMVNLAANGAAGDTVMVGGAGLSGDGTFALDIDLTNDAGGQGASDSITLSPNGAVTGDIELAFNVLGIGGQQEDDILVLDVDERVANSFQIRATGLPDPGEAVIYTLVQEERDSDVYVVDLLNPGIGALAGSIVLTQSLIGSVINRPSSPFVNGLAYEDEDPCGFGGWARFTGGSADTNGLIIQTGANERAVRGEISADFYGLQMGSDFGCFNGYFNGWDIASGGIIGFNEGRSTQPIFALTEAAGLSDRITSFTDVDFFQSYAGVYTTAVRDRFAAELQYRVEQTDFAANNEGVNGSIGLGLNDSQFDSNSNTVSGSLSYALDIAETGLTFVPVAGFAYTQVATDPIRFEDGSIVQVEDFDSRIGFIGGTVSRTQFGADGVSAFNQFVTATHYKDFADDPASVFTSGDGSETRSVTTENLGAYTEVSIGLNYIRILEVGNRINAKQLSASARADWRVSDQLESWGITAQVRVQF